jgi:hypothetical protein
MITKPTPKPDNPEQSKRFIETAKELGADEDESVFDEVFQKIIGPFPRQELASKRASSINRTNARESKK